MTSFDASGVLQSPEYRQELALQRTFMARVYGWMTIGLLATAFTSLVTASSPAIVHALFVSGGVWILIVAELIIALAFTFALRVVPAPVAAGLFLLYSVMTGASISVVLLIYTQASVAATFFITAGMFAGMSAFGYVTKRDLTGLGSFLMMGLWGILIAMVVNFFVASSALDWLISLIGVVIFTGLAAYDTQKIKQGYATGSGSAAIAQKSALFGAFVLYLDFINLFLFLLRFMGNRRD